MAECNGFEISDEKLGQVIRDVLAFISMATAEEITDFVLADWPEGQEHQDWLDTAPVDEIATWVIAGLK